MNLEFWTKHLFSLLALPFMALSFLPLFSVGGRLGESSHLQAGIEANAFLIYVSFCCCASACVPMVIDILLDLVWGDDRTHIGMTDRLFFVIGTIFPGVAYTVVISRFGWTWPNLAVYVECILTAQIICIGAPFCSTIRSSPSGRWTTNLSVILFTFFAAIQLTVLWWGSSSGIFALTWLLIGIIFPYFIWLVLQHFVYLRKLPSIPLGEMLSLMYGALMVFYCTLLLVTHVLLKTYLGSDSSFLAGRVVFTNFVVAALGVFAMVAPGRIARIEMLKSEKSLELKKSFVRYIGHEIRTPMNVFSIGLSILEDTLHTLGIQDKGVLELLDDMKEASCTAIEILNDLLMYDKLSSNLMSLELSQCRDLKFLVDALKIFQLEARKRKISFQFEPISLPPNSYVEVDSSKISQVIRNLASNALKFTENGGKIEVQTYVISGSASAEIQNSAKADSTKDRHWLRIDFVDDGAGIEAANLPRLFKEIVQFNANKLQGGKGTGLGLFIARGIVELHHGVLTAHSEGLNRGATFSLFLPLRRSGIDSVPSSRSNSRAPSLARQFSIIADRNRRIFIAASSDEEHEQNRSTIRQIAEEWIPDSQRSLESLENLTIDRTAKPMGSIEKPSNRKILFGGSDSKSIDSVYDILENGEAVQIIETKSASASLDGNCPSGPVEFCPLTYRKSPNLNLPAPMVASNSTLSTAEKTCRLDPTERPLNGKRVLLVDDSPLNLKLVVALFRRFGACCSQAEDGQIAAEMVEKSLQSSDGPYDMVVMDNLMPVMNGPEACAIMRSKGFNGPIFGLTGHALPDDIAGFLSAGANHVFIKPISAPVLMEYLGTNYQLGEPEKTAPSIALRLC